ncbi:MAG: BON domain-containing protein [Gemmataceae bacterium]|nr:BON domain-containing protein [Gemmataceae bacterium]
METVLLQEQIRCQLRGRIWEVHVIVEDKGISLRGRAPTYYAKQLAQHAVMSASSLPIVANEIEVAQTALVHYHTDEI